MSLLKNAWTAVVNLGWVAVLGVGLLKADLYAPVTPTRAADLPPTQTEVSSLEATNSEPSLGATNNEPISLPEISGLPPTPRKWGLHDIMADIQAEADRRKAEAQRMQQIKDQATAAVEAEADARPKLPIVWTKGIVPHAAQNLHETHEDGEPYLYSLARHQNNELRWTINEFRWRLGVHMNHGKKFWDLSDIDATLDAPLPRDITALKKQNWDLSYRASRLADMMAGEQPQDDWELPPMPSNIEKVPIPSPACNSDFCRVPAR